jgi:hypothetical protein
MPKRAQQSLLSSPEPAGYLRRIGGRAGFAVVVFGLVFAAFQVQGWTMPRLLAVVLIVLLLAAGGVAVLSIVWEAVKEAKRWREDREISTAWIAGEPPGLLDYVPDMKRANKKFIRQMAKLSGDTDRVGNRMARHARVIKVAKFLGPRAAQVWANHTAKGVFRSADFIERRTGHLRATVAEFARAQEGHLASLPAPTNDDERAALAAIGASFASRSATTLEAIVSTEGYRDVVRDSAQQNFSRTLRVSGNQLADQLDAMIVVLRRSLKDSQRLETLCAQRAKS